MRNTQREIPPKTFRRRDGATPLAGDRGAIDRLERDSKDPVPRQTGPAPMSARLSLSYTHISLYVACVN